MLVKFWVAVCKRTQTLTLPPFYVDKQVKSGVKKDKQTFCVILFVSNDRSTMESHVRT